MAQDWRNHREIKMTNYEHKCVLFTAWVHFHIFNVNWFQDYYNIVMFWCVYEVWIWSDIRTILIYTTMRVDSHVIILWFLNVKCLMFALISLQWVLDKQDLMKERQKDFKFLTEEEYWKLQIFFANGLEINCFLIWIWACSELMH